MPVTRRVQKYMQGLCKQTAAAFDFQQHKVHGDVVAGYIYHNVHYNRTCITTSMQSHDQPYTLAATLLGPSAYDLAYLRLWHGFARLDDVLLPLLLPPEHELIDIQVRHGDFDPPRDRLRGGHAGVWHYALEGAPRWATTPTKGPCLHLLEPAPESPGSCTSRLSGGVVEVYSGVSKGLFYPV